MKIEVVRKTEYFSIGYPRTLDEYKRGLFRCGADGNNCRPFAASTEWNFMYSTRAQDGSAQLAVKLVITMRIPKPCLSCAADAERKKISEFVSSTALHERMHADITERHFRKRMRDLERLPRHTDIGKCLLEINSEIQELNDAYDTESNHGALHGAAL